MQIRLEITEAEIRALQEAYAEKSPKPHLLFEEWAGREIALHFSKAYSQRAEWEVQDTLRPVFAPEIQQRLREMSQVP